MIILIGISNNYFIKYLKIISQFILKSEVHYIKKKKED